VAKCISNADAETLKKVLDNMTWNFGEANTARVSLIMLIKDPPKQCQWWKFWCKDDKKTGNKKDHEIRK